MLFCATVDYHFKAFHLPYMEFFKQQGWEVHVAARGVIHLPYVDKKFDIPIERSPFKKNNFRAFRALKKIVRENKYDIIHCHTPLGGVIARVAARSLRNEGSNIIYTAHGFHFCKGAPLLNWILYYPVERYLARLTDTLITINEEDYQLATAHHFRAKEIKYVAGVGVDTKTFSPLTNDEKVKRKQAFGFQQDDILLFHAGEFNKNKNQTFLLHALAHVIKTMPYVKLLLAGEGATFEYCKRLAHQLQIESNVHFLGFRNDIHYLLPMCDIAVSASFREGLPVNVMEAMACSLPVVAVNNRGHRDLIIDNKNGFLLSTWDEKEFAEKIRTLRNPTLRETFGATGREVVLKKFCLQQTLKAKKAIYRAYMKERDAYVG